MSTYKHVDESTDDRKVSVARLRSRDGVHLLARICRKLSIELVCVKAHLGLIVNLLIIDNLLLSLLELTYLELFPSQCLFVHFQLSGILNFIIY